MKKNNNKGFTLAELLIVVAIIAVLVAIAIPVFSGQLEKSREATDASNIRAAYAEVAASALTDPDEDHKAEVELKQKQDEWQNKSIDNIAGVVIDDDFPSKGATVTVQYTSSDGKIKIADREVTTSFLGS